MVSGYLRLQGVFAGYSDTYWVLHDDFSIGRAADQEVVLDDPSISRRHAEVRLTHDGWIIRDHESTNGTFVNGDRVGGEGRVLQQGDVLRCGRVVLLAVRLIEGLPAEAPSWPDCRQRGSLELQEET